MGLSYPKHIALNHFGRWRPKSGEVNSPEKNGIRSDERTAEFKKIYTRKTRRTVKIVARFM